MFKKNMNLNFQNPYSMSTLHMTNFNNFLMMIMCMLLCLSLTIMFIQQKNNLQMNLAENNIVETFWTSLPCMILLSIAAPSIFLLYSTEENSINSIPILIRGNQWFWSFEYPQMKNKSNDSIMINSKTMRCLMASNPLIIPAKTPISFLITSSDVIHSFSINSMSIKTDAVPGRINMSTNETMKSGALFGQCSEICGANHSFMPIFLNSINFKNL